jgi:hypothetical protein
VSQLTCRISGGSIAHLWRSMSQPISSMSQPMCVGSVIMLSLRLYVSVIANVCHTHCVGDNIIAIVCRCIALVITSLRIYVVALRMYIVVIALMIHIVALVTSLSWLHHCVDDTQRCNSTPCAACIHLVTDRLGSGASDGYPLNGLTFNGWYVRHGRDPPSMQRRKSAQSREGMRRS